MEKIATAVKPVVNPCPAVRMGASVGCVRCGRCDREFGHINEREYISMADLDSGSAFLDDEDEGAENE